MKLTSFLQKITLKTFEVCEAIVIIIVHCNLLKVNGISVLFITKKHQTYRTIFNGFLQCSEAFEE